MLISATLNTIADADFQSILAKNKNSSHDSIVSFIEDEISKDKDIPNSSFENFQLAFSKKIAVTLNKNGFIQSEILSIKGFLQETFLNIPNGNKIQETIYRLILNDTDKHRIFHYYIKDFNENRIAIFVRVIYSYQLIKYLCFLEGEPMKNLPSEMSKAQDDNKFFTSLEDNGLFALGMVKALSKEKQNKLIELMSKQNLPYNIAMAEHLGFIKYLLTTNTGYKVQTILANLFNEGKNRRSVKGNISVLNELSNEDRKRYTSHLHKKTVLKDYNSLLVN